MFRQRQRYDWLIDCLLFYALSTTFNGNGGIENKNIFFLKTMFEITRSWLWLFVWSYFSSTLECFTHIETSPLSVRAANFDLCSALMTTEQWGFFSVPHLLWHGASAYNGHLIFILWRDCKQDSESENIIKCVYLDNSMS